MISGRDQRSGPSSPILGRYLLFPTMMQMTNAVVKFSKEKRKINEDSCSGKRPLTGCVSFS